MLDRSSKGGVSNGLHRFIGFYIVGVSDFAGDFGGFCWILVDSLCEFLVILFGLGLAESFFWAANPRDEDCFLQVPPPQRYIHIPYLVLLKMIFIGLSRMIFLISCYESKS